LQTLIISEAQEVWLDELSIQRGNSPARKRANKQQIPKTGDVLILNGRFLVRGLESDGSSHEQESDSRREKLIQLNSARQKALTESLEKCLFADKILTKQFETEGKGDLFNRFYTYFHYEIQLKKGYSL